MFDQGEMLLSAESGDKVLETLIGELCPIVGDERPRYSEPSKYVSLVETKDVV